MIFAKGGRVASLFYSNFNTANYILLIQIVISVLSHEYDIYRMTVSNWYVPSSVFSGVAKLMSKWWSVLGQNTPFYIQEMAAGFAPAESISMADMWLYKERSKVSVTSLLHTLSWQLWKITGSRIRNRIWVFSVAAQTHILADFTTNIVKHNKGVCFCRY